MGDLQAHLPHHAECSAVFGQKQHDPHTPPPYSPNLAPSDIFLFPQIKKVPKGECFADVEEMKQKMAEAVKGIKIDKFKNYSEQWKKCLCRYIAFIGEYFGGD